MGPTLVETMVQADAERARARKLHPFFTRQPEAVPGVSSAATDVVTDPELNQDISGSELDAGSVWKKQPSANSLAVQDAPAPKKQRQGTTGAKVQSSEGCITNHFIRPGHADHGPVASDQTTHRILTPPLSDVPNTMNERSSMNAQGSEHRVNPIMNADGPNTAPKNSKVLKFNPKTGTLGSPPKQTPAKPPTRIVTIKYGNTEEKRKDIGHKITQILERPPERKASKRGRPRKQQKQPKEEKPSGQVVQGTPPLFSGRTQRPVAPAVPDTEAKKSPPRRQTISMVTPVSPRRQREPAFGHKVTSFGNTKPVGTKVPGAMHPAWPNRGMSHVRGDEAEPRLAQSPLRPEAGPEQPRKSKGQTISITSEESVLDNVSRRLDLPSVRVSLPKDDNSPSPPPEELRLPRRQFESGRKLQRRIRQQLQTISRFQRPASTDSDCDELAGPPPRRTHPAVDHLFTRLETSLSAYDQSTCENSAWAQKYAPTTAEQVLQAGKEALYLREWLETLKVQTVETGQAEGGGGKVKDRSDKAPKKRRKNRLDGFVVDSDAEDYELDEVSEDETDWRPAGSSHARTVMLAGGRKSAARLPNAVVMSGPHGSGKTAAAYAVAKELGFEVFEINSSSRRSGKDLLERVGDMTRNHLVQQHQAERPAAEGSDDEVTRDLKSGKQGMMTAFFKPRPGDEAKATKDKQPKVQQPKGEAKQAPKAQKQSLILLEEVDVLYEEDKQFWATLMGMIAQSKRPFVMTCNDESLVPIQSMSLYGILRFTPPPEALAADVCLLIAANEGHALDRQAVGALYASRGNDLRAAITELNYWCQIGVGDRRGGFDWFYLRWPKGSDLDENGDVVRVISEDTYVRGMGWLVRDVITRPKDSRQPDGEEETLRQCWDHWRRPFCDWHTSLDMESCTASMSRAVSRASRAEDLVAYDDFCETLSTADLYSDGAFGNGLQCALDPSLPDLPPKVKEDFISGRQLLEGDPVVLQAPMADGISTSLSALARQDLLQHTVRRGESEASSALAPVDEGAAVAMLESTFRSSPRQLERRDLSLAFDPIAASENAGPTLHLDPSVFDRTLEMIVLDVAPWVRSIVSYDQSLMVGRKKLSSLLSEGGQRKRMRNTRSAYSALEGGERQSTRREKYFEGIANPTLVLKTGLKAWRDVARQATESTASSRPVSPEAMDWTEGG